MALADSDNACVCAGTCSENVRTFGRIRVHIKLTGKTI